jgi:hypothetical protein
MFLPIIPCRRWSLPTRSKSAVSVLVGAHTAYPLSRKTPFPGGGDLPTVLRRNGPFVVAAASQVTRRITGTGVPLAADAIRPPSSSPIDQASQEVLFWRRRGWNQDEMEDHGTVYATRFKRMRESSRR